MTKSKLDQKTEKPYFPYRFSRIIIEKITLGFLTEHKACEKYGMRGAAPSLKLIRQWRRRVPLRATTSIVFYHI